MIEELGARGHRVSVLGDWANGGDAQLIGMDPESGVIFGGSDARGEGLALGI